MRARVFEFAPGLLAGVAGGVAADFLVAFLLGRGFWMPIISGAIVGLACGQASPVASRGRGVIIALFTLGLVIVIQWQLWTPNFPISDPAYDGTLPSYIRHLHQLPALTLVAMSINVVIAYWWGREQGIRFAGRRSVVD